MILLDTSALIEFLNRTGSRYDHAVATLISNDADIALAEITLTEVLQGIRNERDYREVRAALMTFPIMTLKSHDSYIKAADLYRKCRAKGLTIRSTVDLLIAQTAIEHNAELVHNDRDFEAIASVSSLRLYPLPQSQERLILHEEMATYAVSVAGTSEDLDESLETAALE